MTLTFIYMVVILKDSTDTSAFLYDAGVGWDA